jgi:predicted DNA-binding transcriptional regulator AlpA
MAATSRKGRQHRLLTSELIPFPIGAERIGLSVSGAAKIIARDPTELPPIVRIGSRRFWMRKHLESWLNKRLALGDVTGGDHERQAAQ